jgi:DNA-directed RNA polymerase specialized sigma24 family protein
MELQEAEEYSMSEQRDDFQARCYALAERAIYLYAQDLLSAEVLAERMLVEWERLGAQDAQGGQPSHAVLTRLALRICSRELCGAWRSSNRDLRNRAFANLRRYLERSLLHTRYAEILQYRIHAFEDVLHQTLEQLHLSGLREGAGPDDPASFLKWTQVILLRQARAFLLRRQQEENVSLDDEPELFGEQFVDISNDPLRHLLILELQQKLTEIILGMRNRRYRQVLLYTYIAGVDEKELAQRLEVQVQDIYLWRHRALKVLRNQPEVMRTLRLLVE